MFEDRVEEVYEEFVEIFVELGLMGRIRMGRMGGMLWGILGLF